MSRRARTLILALAIGTLLAAFAAARAEWLQPDATWREAQFQLRTAQRDTVGHPDDPARLDSLAVALLRIGRTEDAAVHLLVRG